MTVDLSSFRFNDAGPMLNEFGGTITPGLGAPMQRVDRIGDRWSWRFATAPVAIEPEGRLWASLLTRAKKTGCQVPIVQADMNVGAPGLPLVRVATNSGRTIPLKGLTPHYAIRAGQWINYVVDGTSYLDMIEGQAIADASGNADVTIQNLLRAPLPVNGGINLAKPVIEGWLADPIEWPVPVDGVTSFSFTVMEYA